MIKLDMKDNEPRYESVEETAVVRVVARGMPYRRRIDWLPDGTPVYASFRTGHLVGQTYNSDETVYAHPDNIPFGLHPEDFPTITYGEEIQSMELIGVNGPTIPGVRRTRTSHRYSKLPEKGDPDHKIAKPANSFCLGRYPKDCGKK